MQSVANDMNEPLVVALKNQRQFRIIPSVYPPINFFEDIVDPAEMELLWEIENLTNDRLRQECGDIFLVSPEDRISGPGSSVVMAAFTHIGKPSRFTDGSFGIYYASMERETAIRETIYHREQFLSQTNEPACEITMRVYQGKIIQSLHDVRALTYKKLHDSHIYTESQSFGKELRARNSWGIIYNSVRCKSGQCIAAFKPKAVSIPIQEGHLRYVWDSEKIVDVFEITSVHDKNLRLP